MRFSREGAKYAKRRRNRIGTEKATKKDKEENKADHEPLLVRTSLQLVIPAHAGIQFDLY